MNVKRAIDLNTWPRREHFKMFLDFDEPFFGICTEIDCTSAYRVAKETGVSFFLLYLHRSLEAANDLEPFRYRTEGDDVVCYESVHASTVVDRDDRTIGFSYISFYRDFGVFVTEAEREIQAVRNDKGLKPALQNENVIHYTVLPWIKFTGFSHARRFGKRDSIPKIAFGKMHGEGERLLMPVSINAHHGLMDGFHVAQYLERFQDLLNK